MKPFLGLMAFSLALGVAGRPTLDAPGGAQAAQAPYFDRIATLPVHETLPEGTDRATETVAEIVSVTGDGMTLVHTDSPGAAIAFVDIADPSDPRPLGRTALDGEPTSVTVVGGHALVGVVTSASHAEPSGHVAVVDVASREVVARCDVGGQLDSLAAGPDGRFLAVAVENERDEDLDGGALPQPPAGYLAVFRLGGDGMPADCGGPAKIALTGLAEVAPEDPEPEFVSINADNVAVVTLQENNHLTLVDLEAGAVTGHFSAGTASLSAIPTAEGRRVDGTGSLADVRREPDAVAWLDGARFVTADEGDYQGGSRGFTIWTAGGEVAYESGALMEHLAMAHGHYPAKRAARKGVEPEGVAAGVYGGTPLFFVNAERAGLVAVFEDRGAGVAPELLQVLPTGTGPEGVLAIPSRDLLVVASEEDDAEEGVRATIGIYRRTAAAPAYPTIVSQADPATGAPIGWGALSGLAADPRDANRLYAVSDSFYDVARIFTIDAAHTPARIVSHVDVTGGAAGKYDLEGIAVAADGGFWLASEGNPDKGMDNRLLKVRADGTVVEEVPLPEPVAAAASRFGFEGVSEYVDAGGTTRVVLAVQRSWKDDAKGMVKLAVYTPADGAWGFVAYPLDAPKSPAGGWVGLSEITHLGKGEFAVLERDNRGGPDAALKMVYRVSLADVAPAPAGEPAPRVEKAAMLDLLPAMAAAKGWTPDKVEGFAVTADGTMVAVTDNDGVDGAVSETQFLRLGPVRTAAK
ncbi:esterase-like activity of phytase family protein [Arenibaculum sp.]|uniref:esterase-like activity of phytase family protein n=1 Tax=Arenibaculum sp. TaxID=2865862 RepID=UPI002E166A65|nr:esterase-like activity of phytase family protein [Arenibaculum sp.]